MPLCSFDGSSIVYMSTPVENLFIDEYLPGARPEYVKVYLYGLKLCYHPQNAITLDTFARDIHLDESVVRDAYAYWERQGIVRRVSERPLLVHYYSIQKITMSEPAENEDAMLNGLYKLSKINEGIQGIFGDKLLSSADFELIATWIETYGFEDDAVYAIVKHHYEQKNGRMTLAYLEPIMKQLADEHMTSFADAEAIFERATASRVLHALGIRKRYASAIENDLYNKWIGEWGFTHDAVLEACKQTKSISDPSFAYIDAVLKDCHEAGMHTSREVRDFLQSGDENRQRVKDVLQRIGSRQSPGEALQSTYRAWAQRGFSHDAILEAAAHAQATGNARFEDIGPILDECAAAGCFEPVAMIHLFADKQAFEDEVREFQERAGIDPQRKPGKDWRDLFQLWTEQRGMQVEMVFLAAEQARGTQNKTKYIHSILEDWTREGIRSFSAAKDHVEARRRFAATGASGPSGAVPPSGGAPGAAAKPPARRLSKNVTAQNISQRPTQPEDFEHLITRWDEEGEDA